MSGASGGSSYYTPYISIRPLVCLLAVGTPATYATTALTGGWYGA